LIGIFTVAFEIFSQMWEPSVCLAVTRYQKNRLAVNISLKGFTTSQSPDRRQSLELKDRDCVNVLPDMGYSIPQEEVIDECNRMMISRRPRKQEIWRKVCSTATSSRTNLVWRHSTGRCHHLKLQVYNVYWLNEDKYYWRESKGFGYDLICGNICAWWKSKQMLVSIAGAAVEIQTLHLLNTKTGRYRVCPFELYKALLMTERHTTIITVIYVLDCLLGR
jgi:hypothetical protein